MYRTVLLILSFSLALFAKPNDECASALPLAVNPGESCSTVTPGTVEGATFSGGGGAGNCSFFGPDDDVWFSFVATSNNHTITLQNVSGSSLLLGMRGYVQACPTGQEQAFCSDNLSYQSFNFTPGAIYYLQVFTLTDIPDQTTTFDVCVTTVPIVPPPANDNCANAVPVGVSLGENCVSVTSGTVAGATASGVGSNCPFATGADDDVWFSFIAISNDHTISIQNAVGSSTQMAFNVHATACPTGSGATFCSNGSVFQSFDFTPGAVYYIQVFTGTNIPGQTTTFDVCVTTVPIVPPPANDDCANAIPIAVNPGETCFLVTSGTVAGATFSGGGGAGNCSFFGPDDDVWFSFVATSNNHTITLQNAAGSSLLLGMRGYLQACPTSQAQAFCSDDMSYQSFNFTTGATYYLQVFSSTDIPGQTTTFDVCLTTDPPTRMGGEEVQQGRVFPQLTSGTLNLVGWPIDASFAVLDMAGRTVATSNTDHLDISAVDSGLYVVVVRDHADRIISRIPVTRF
jgi:large repetitive protein